MSSEQRQQDNQQAGTTADMQRIERLQLWCNALIMVAAFLAVGVGTCQMSAMRAQLDLMRTDQRAWIGVVKPSAPELTADTELQFTFSITNTGRTPGTLKAMGVKIFNAPKNANIERRLKQPGDPYMPADTEAVIAPGETRRMGTIKPLVADKKTIDDILDGTQNLWFVIYLT